MLLKRKVGLYEALLPLATVLDRNAVLGDDKVSLQIRAHTGSEGKLVVAQRVVKRLQVFFLKAFLALAVLIFETISIWNLRMESENGSRVLPGRILGIDSRAIDQQMLHRSPVADMRCTRECRELHGVVLEWEAVLVGVQQLKNRRAKFFYEGHDRHAQTVAVGSHEILIPVQALIFASFKEDIHNDLW
ncbi:hypothetical protein D3C71_1121740 [compost metagenome]